MSHVGHPDVKPWGLLGALGNKRGEAISAWLLPAMPELLEYPQGIPPFPPPSPGFGEGSVGEHHFVPCFHFPFSFHCPVVVQRGHAGELALFRDWGQGGTRQDRGLWPHLLGTCLQLGSAAGGAAS